jgi:hypothetical protein
MVETILFLGIIILFFFLPVSFRIYYHKLGQDDLFVFEMTFLKGLLKRRKVISFLQNTSQYIHRHEKTSGKWFFFRRAEVKEVNSPYQFHFRGINEFWQRYQNYGLGITLLTYFLPARYQRWLLVAQRLEKKGRFDRFIWVTRLGTRGITYTSIIYGLLWGLKLGLFNTLHRHYKFKQKPEIKVFYNFQQSQWDTLFDCIFRVKLGYIIIVALMARFQARARP